MTRKVIISLIACCLPLLGCNKSSDQTAQSNAAKPAAKPAPVVVASVTQKDIPLAINVVGKAEAISTVQIKSRVDGQILTVDFREGQYVKKGQRLFQLDPRSFQAQVRQGEANLARDRAQLEKAKLDVRRYTELQQKGFVSAEKLSELHTVQAAAESVVKADQAALDLARLQVSYTNITAPLSGVTGTLQAHVGNNVKANDTNLVVINQTQPIYVGFAVPENRLAQIKDDIKKGPVRTTVTIPQAQTAPLVGNLVFIDNTVDPTTGTILMKAQLDNSENQLTPGQFVNVSVVAQVLTNALVVPLQAVQNGPDGTFVFVVNKESKAEMRPVKLVSSDKTEAAMASGLTPGEQVIIDGQSRVMPGGKVEARAPQPTSVAVTKSANQ